MDISCSNVVKLNFTPSSLPPTPHPCVVNSANISDNQISNEMEITPCPPVLVRPPREKQIRDIALLLTEENEESMAPFVFLLNNIWWKSWLDYVSGSSTTVPSAISNNLIVLNESIDGDSSDATFQDVYSRCRCQLSTDLMPNVDYVGLPSEVWEALHSWYGGGPPLPRHWQPLQCMKTENLDDQLLTASWLQSHHQDCLAILDAIQRQISKYSENIDCYPAIPPTIMEILQDDSASYPMSVDEGSNVNPSNKTAVGVAKKGMIKVRSMNFNDCGASAMNDAINSPLSTSVSPTTAKITKTDRRSANSCFVCRQVAVSRCAVCCAVYYCSQVCQKTHWKYHKNWCTQAKCYKDLPIEEFQKQVVVGRRGKVGLHNLGNSCYLGSCLQCLSHTTPLTTHFLSSRYESQVNSTSRDGTGGKLAKEYATLMKDLWFDSKAATSPINLKKILGKLREEYAGFQQHDAHELLELLLDKLHEDINLVVGKPYTEKCEGDGSNDGELAQLAWHRHGLRENSEVRNILGSQMRSQLVCPDCGKKAVCFEYQQTIPIPIPRNTNRVFKIIYIPVDGNLSRDLKEFSLPREVGTLDGTSIDVWKNLLSNYSVKREALRPTVYGVTCDRVSSISFVKKKVNQMIDSSVTKNGIHPYKPNQKLVLFELGGPNNTTVVSILNDSDSVSRVREGCTIAAFAMDDLPGVLIVVNRKISIPDESNKGDIALTGRPFALSFDLNWSCLKIRMLIWQQIVRCVMDIADYFKELCDLAAVSKLVEKNLSIPSQICFAILKAELTKDVNAMKEFSRHFPLRFVKQFGEADFSNRQVNYDCMASGADSLLPRCGLSFTGGFLLQQDRALGSSVPHDSTVKIGEFLGMSARDCFRFVSVDWSGNWLKLLVPNELESLHLHSSVANISETPFNENNRNVGSTASVITLDQCLTEHTREELLDEANAWYCSHCKKHQCAKKLVKFWAPNMPEVLVLALKRFEFRDLTSVGRSGMAHREKIESFVDYPVAGLDMAPYCEGYPHFDNIGDSTVQTIVQENGILYDLFAVCNHYGRMGFGHYTAVARDWEGERLSSSWSNYDDNDVTSGISEKQVVSPAAYILFYRKRPIV